jgi:hypothetical protein
VTVELVVDLLAPLGSKRSREKLDEADEGVEPALKEAFALELETVPMLFAVPIGWLC